MARRRLLWCLALLGVFATRAFSQSDSPIALRSAARAVTAGELSSVTELAKSGDSRSQLLLGLRLSLMAEQVGDEKSQAGMYASSISWLRRAANKGSAPAEYYLADTELELTGTSSWKLVDCKEVSVQLDKAISQNYASAMTELGRQYVGTAGCAP
jgi:TPR repeat protein